MQFPKEIPQHIIDFLRQHASLDHNKIDVYYSEFGNELDKFTKTLEQKAVKACGLKVAEYLDDFIRVMEMAKSAGFDVSATKMRERVNELESYGYPELFNVETMYDFKDNIQSIQTYLNDDAQDDEDFGFTEVERLKALNIASEMVLLYTLYYAGSQMGLFV